MDFDAPGTIPRANPRSALKAGSRGVAGLALVPVLAACTGTSKNNNAGGSSKTTTVGSNSSFSQWPDDQCGAHADHDRLAQVPVGDPRGEGYPRAGPRSTTTHEPASGPGPDDPAAPDPSGHAAQLRRHNQVPHRACDTQFRDQRPGYRMWTGQRTRQAAHGPGRQRARVDSAAPADARARELTPADGPSNPTYEPADTQDHRFCT